MCLDPMMANTLDLALILDFQRCQKILNLSRWKNIYKIAQNVVITAIMNL